jgi:uncharacterized protein
MATPTLEPFVRHWAVLLVTYRRDGTPVGTPVSIAVEGESAFVRTWDTAWKFRRIPSNLEVEAAPARREASLRGRRSGPAPGLLEGDVSAYAGRLLARKHPVLHGLVVPLAHRLMAYRTVHVELTPVPGNNSGTGESALRPVTSSARSSGSRRPAG